MFLSAKNISIGVSLSVFIGILAGLIPAIQAARMDPVEAIRK
jgi:putative ABC transport system permease protein